MTIGQLIERIKGEIEHIKGELNKNFDLSQLNMSSDEISQHMEKTVMWEHILNHLFWMLKYIEEVMKGK